MSNEGKGKWEARNDSEGVTEGGRREKKSQGRRCERQNVRKGKDVEGKRQEKNGR